MTNEAWQLRYVWVEFQPRIWIPITAETYCAEQLTPKVVGKRALRCSRFEYDEWHRNPNLQPHTYRTVGGWQ
jgi:hypothetical protein